MTELAGLPTTGPVSLDTVNGELSYVTGEKPDRDARVALRVGAVNTWVRALPVAGDSLTFGDPPPQWPDHVVLGATMLATRLWRRKDSPSGVEAFTDQGAVYVSRNDPDVAQLLRIGSYTAPKVG